MRAKFYCDLIEEVGHGVEVSLSAVTDDGTPENKSFNTATPSGDLKMWIDNPDAVDFFEVGKTYYLDFSKTGEES